MKELNASEEILGHFYYFDINHGLASFTFLDNSVYSLYMSELLTIKQILENLKPELSERFHVSSIGIFGSVARNEMRSDSDVDIIVDFDQPIGIGFIDLANFLEKQVNRSVDLVSRNGVKQPYFAAIEKEIIYV
jgi:predicted nucleotidyltransferase